MKNKLIQVLLQSYPQLGEDKMNELIHENMISPFVLKLPRQVLVQAQEFVGQCFELRSSRTYIEALKVEAEQRQIKDPGNHSILMSYDFHLDLNGSLKLIEVNTNAAFLALGTHLYQAQGLALPVADFSLEEIRNNILNELKLVGRAQEKPRIAIVDVKPPEQRLFSEFLVYQALFTKWGFESEILDVTEDLSRFDFVYNRSTDFYLESPEHQNLKKLFLDKEICLSPHPFEYLLLADKQRMIDWYAQHLSLRPFLPECLEVEPAKADELWQKRKSLFFKPKRAYGSKQSYKGASMSRRVFDEILQQDFIAQTYVAAPEVNLETPLGPQAFKYDLRFYAYEGRVQQVMARLYQGQVTNSRTPLGGFAPVFFN